MNKDILSQLNPRQQEAVEQIEGPLLVLAGAGTGKTRVITYRIAYMLQKGINPENILGVTFTNKAAREMKDRVERLVSINEASKVTLGTFHSLCSRILRSKVRILDFTPNFTIAGDSDQRGILKQVISELNYHKDEIPVEAVSNAISRAKSNMQSVNEYKHSTVNDFEDKVATIYTRYQQVLKNQNMLDFDDLLFFVVYIFKDYPKILKEYQERYQYILVDEYQDTNKVQFELLHLLAEKQMNICVVGDDDQSIYGWRGAVIDNILNFPSHFPKAKTVQLEQNYRSTNKILESANRIIAGNNKRYSKNLWSNKGTGENIRLVHAESSEKEAEFIAMAIQDLKLHNPEATNEDFAILYRSNYLSRTVEQAMKHFHIPYRIIGAKEFFQRKEILDAIAYLKLLVNPKDDQSLLRILNVPPRGIGDKSISVLKELQKTTALPLTQLLSDPAFLNKIPSNGAFGAQKLNSCFTKYREIFKEAGGLKNKTERFLADVEYLNGMLKIYRDREEAERRQENVYELINTIYQFEASSDRSLMLMDFIEQFSLLDDNDKVEESDGNQAVTLMTVHAAKGLEFPYVFIMGMEKGIFPHERSEAQLQLDEERRLFYVALTRAKLMLIISFADTRMRYGQIKQERPSSFLNDLPEEYLDSNVPKNFFRQATEEEVTLEFTKILAKLKKEAGRN